MQLQLHCMLRERKLRTASPGTDCMAHVVRERNKRADELASQALLAQSLLRRVQEEVLLKHKAERGAEILIHFGGGPRKGHAASAAVGCLRLPRLRGAWEEVVYSAKSIVRDSWLAGLEASEIAVRLGPTLAHHLKDHEGFMQRQGVREFI